jgi:hypothetical protein
MSAGVKSRAGSSQPVLRIVQDTDDASAAGGSELIVALLLVRSVFRDARARVQKEHAAAVRLAAIEHVARGGPPPTLPPPPTPPEVEEMLALGLIDVLLAGITTQGSNKAAVLTLLSACRDFLDHKPARDALLRGGLLRKVVVLMRTHPKDFEVLHRCVGLRQAVNVYELPPSLTCFAPLLSGALLPTPILSAWVIWDTPLLWTLMRPATAHDKAQAAQADDIARKDRAATRRRAAKAWAKGGASAVEAVRRSSLVGAPIPLRALEMEEGVDTARQEEVYRARVVAEARGVVEETGLPARRSSQVFLPGIGRSVDAAALGLRRTEKEAPKAARQENAEWTVAGKESKTPAKTAVLLVPSQLPSVTNRTKGETRDAVSLLAASQWQSANAAADSEEGAALQAADQARFVAMARAGDELGDSGRMKEAMRDGEGAGRDDFTLPGAVGEGRASKSTAQVALEHERASVHGTRRASAAAPQEPGQLRRASVANRRKSTLEERIAKMGRPG